MKGQTYKGVQQGHQSIHLIRCRLHRSSQAYSTLPIGAPDLSQANRIS